MTNKSIFRFVSNKNNYYSIDNLSNNLNNSNDLDTTKSTIDSVSCNYNIRDLNNLQTLNSNTDIRNDLESVFILNNYDILLYKLSLF